MISESQKEKIFYLKEFSKRVERVLNKFHEVSDGLILAAKQRGIVIVTAINDHIMFLGAVDQDVELPEINTNFKLDFDGTVLDDSENSFAETLVCNRYEFNWNCYFKISNINYEIFNDYGIDGKEKYCQGIVFYLEDLAKTTTGGRIMMLSEVDKLMLSNFKIASGAIQIEENGSHEAFDFLLFENEGLGVLYKNRLFKIPFEELADLAVDARLFGETTYD